MKRQTLEDIQLVMLGAGVFVLMYLIGKMVANTDILAPGNEFYLIAVLIGAAAPFYVLLFDR